MTEPNKIPQQTPEDYRPKKPEILNIAEAAVNGGARQYPADFRIKPSGKVASYTGAAWPHSNAYAAAFSAIALFYGREPRLNEKGEQINDDLNYRMQGALTTEAYGIQYSRMFDEDTLQNCLGIYGLTPTVADCTDWPESQVREFICAAVSSGRTVITVPTDYKDMHFVFGYKESGAVLSCCPFLDGDDAKNNSWSFSKYKKRRNRTAGLARLIIIEDSGERLDIREAYRQSLINGLKMLTEPSDDMDFPKLKGAGAPLYDAWIELLRQSNAENSGAFYMEFPVFPQFIILYENRLHLSVFLDECDKLFDSPGLRPAREKCAEICDLAGEEALIWFKDERSKQIYNNMTNNEHRDMLIGILEKCRAAELAMTECLREFISIRP